MKNMAQKGTGASIYNYPGGFQKNMSSQEAMMILSLNKDCNNEEITKAYSNLMKINHPDRGTKILIIKFGPFFFLLKIFV